MGKYCRDQRSKHPEVGVIAHLGPEGLKRVVKGFTGQSSRKSRKYQRELLDPLWGEHVDTGGFLQPSGSSLATAIAAAYNIVKPKLTVLNPEGMSADQAKKWASLVGECADIIHSKVAVKEAG